MRFVNKCTGEIEQIQWWFSDTDKPVTTHLLPGAESKAGTVTHHFKSPGRYTVRIVAIGPGGRSEASKSVTVEPPPPPPVAPPKAHFVMDQSRGTVPLTVTFQNRSEGMVTQFNLDFGDGTPVLQTSNFVDCTHTYEMPGKYVPTLRAEGAEQFLPSVYSPSEQSIIVRSPPSWTERNWWILGLCLVAAMGITAAIRPMVAQRSWIARHRHLRGTLHWKPATPKSAPWRTIPITATNGEFSYPIPRDEMPSGSQPMILKLKKLLDAALRSERYSVELSRNERVATNALVEPGKEKFLAEPGILVRYNS